MNPHNSKERSVFAALRQFVRSRATRERCDLCNAELGEEHAHLVEIEARRLRCACEPCAILFSNQGAGKYRRVPRRVVALPDLRMTDALWGSLHVPINLVFIFHSTPVGGVIAQFPSPAGATEAPLDQDTWHNLVQENPGLQNMEPDVEGLLVNRVGPVPLYFRVPIDECYKLTGLVRMHWRGLSGGTAVWGEIGQFFTRLQEKATKGDKP
jgi:hypothetical protein